MGGEIIRMTMESCQAPPIHFGQDFLTATLAPVQMPTEDCITNRGNSECKEGHIGRVYWKCCKL